jgi:serine/threonine protein kinase
MATNRKMFEDIHEIAENNAYLKAVDEKEASLEMLDSLPSYEDPGTQAIEERLLQEGKLSFDAIFHEPTGFYFIRLFLQADYAGDKAMFIKDIESFRKLRFQSARYRIAKLLYQRYVAPENAYPDLPQDCSVFEMVGSTEFQEFGSKNAQSVPDSKQSVEPLDQDALEQANEQFGNEISKHSPHRVDRDDLKMASTESQDAEDDKEDVVVERTPIPDHGDADHGDADHSEATSSRPATGDGLPVQAISPAAGARAFTPVNIGSNDKSAGVHSNQSALVSGDTNAIGVYGNAVRIVEEAIENEKTPPNLFDDMHEEVMTDLQLDVFPRFRKSKFYKKYVCTKIVEQQIVDVKMFQTFRILGRGGFGAVHACKKKDSGAIYAMKVMNKKLIKVKSALPNVMEERDVLVRISSPFVTNLKYALQDDVNLYLVMDLMLGGDLKFHLINSGRFKENRARMYAAEVLLGLEHLHSLCIIYRDLKLENVLLDGEGHARLSDLGLAVVTKTKYKGYAGTPGYTAPEMIKNKMYGPEVDFFSFGVLIYRMLAGTKPFKGRIDRDLDKAVLEREPRFSSLFSPEAKSLIQGLLQKRPDKRLGYNGCEQIKSHPFFSTIDWGLLEAGYMEPVFKPNKYDVNAASLRDIGDFDLAKLKNVRLSDRFKRTVKRFNFTSVKAIQEEMVNVLSAIDENVKYGKFDATPAPKVSKKPAQDGCCSLM